MTSSEDQTSDAAHVERVRRGDLAAFDQLTQRHMGVVCAIARGRLGQREVAKDLMREVFVRVCVHLSSLRDPRGHRPAQLPRRRDTGQGLARSSRLPDGRIRSQLAHPDDARLMMPWAQPGANNLDHFTPDADVLRCSCTETAWRGPFGESQWKISSPGPHPHFQDATSDFGFRGRHDPTNAARSDGDIVRCQVPTL